MKEPRVKQNNILALSCTSSSNINGAPISSAIIDAMGVKKLLQVTPIDNTHFTVILDTTNLNVGRAQFEVKIGNVSSDTAFIQIDKSIV